MIDRERLYRLIDALPEAELAVVERFIAFIRWQLDPVRAALDAAPIDDEPETEEERQAVAEAKAELARGEAIPADVAWKDLLG
ncbi:MAG: hypothetical protein FJZ01_09155 [Candidatus Sericytochromatia bacterium]|nr:hypothetical protein [Candidatus Tanganyikabacteria bacterium]